MQAARCIAHPNKPTVQTHFSTVGMEVKLKLQTIEYCVQMCKIAEFKRVEKITSAIRRLLDHRNYVAHNFSTQRKGQVVIHVLKMSRRGPLANKTFTPRQIEEFANLIQCRTRQLDTLLHEIGIGKPTEPTSQPQ